jgi:hypothetical protein
MNIQQFARSTLGWIEQAGKMGELGDWAALVFSATGQKEWADKALDFEAWSDLVETGAPAVKSLLEGKSFAEVAQKHGGAMLGAATDVLVTNMVSEWADKLHVPDWAKTIITDHLSDWSQEIVEKTVSGLAANAKSVSPNTTVANNIVGFNRQNQKVKQEEIEMMMQYAGNNGRA